MRKFFSKIKSCLAAFRITLISFPFKVKGLDGRGWRDPQPDYGVLDYPKDIGGVSPTRPVDVIIKMVPRLLIAITFFVGIVSFIKIRKINDKDIKKKKIKNTIITISILVILIVIILLLPRFLKKFG